MVIALQELKVWIILSLSISKKSSSNYNRDGATVLFPKNVYNDVIKKYQDFQINACNKSIRGPIWVGLVENGCLALELDVGTG